MKSYIFQLLIAGTSTKKKLKELKKKLENDENCEVNFWRIKKRK